MKKNSRPPGVALVSLEGDLDVSQKAAITRALQDAADAAVLVVDLGKVRYIDSAALTVFVEHFKESQRMGRDLRLVVARDQAIHRIFEVTGLTRLFKLYENLEQAKRV